MPEISIRRESPDVRRATCAIARAARSGDRVAETAARRDLSAAKLADYIARALAADPPLTDEARQRLAELLTGGVR